MNNIVLIGMPGCGKSTTGVLVAKTLLKDFVDTDLLIQTHEGISLQEIINTKGIVYFEKIEENVLSTLNCSNSVIATGGSAVYYPLAMNHLKSIGKVIYLKISYENMLIRINNIKTRGIVLKDNESLYEMYNKRVSLYEKYSDLTINCNSLNIEETVEAITKYINNI